MVPFLDRRLIVVAAIVCWLLSIAASLWMVMLVRGVGQRLDLLEGQFQAETMARTAQLNDVETRIAAIERPHDPTPTAVPAPKKDSPKRPLRGLLHRLKGRK